MNTGYESREQPTGTSTTLKDQPIGERPRERLIERGAAVLSPAELIAILVRTGLRGVNALEIGKQLISKFGSLGAMARASVDDLRSVRGIGPDKAVTLVAAFTSMAAIFALSAGYCFGWVWLDPVMGLVGAAVIISWAFTLLRDTSSILVDRIPASSDLPVVIREGIEGDGDSKITDLHIWQVGSGKYAAIIGVVAHNPKTADEYRNILKIHEELVHVSVEVQLCHEHPSVKCA